MGDHATPEPVRWEPPRPHEASIVLDDPSDGPHGENPELIDEGDER